MPGGVVSRLSDKEREALSQLKSSDIDGSPSCERIDFGWVVPEEYYRNKNFEKEKLEFDKKFLKK